MEVKQEDKAKYAVLKIANYLRENNIFQADFVNKSVDIWIIISKPGENLDQVTDKLYKILQENTCAFIVWLMNDLRPYVIREKTYEKEEYEALQKIFCQKSTDVTTYVDQVLESEHQSNQEPNSPATDNRKHVRQNNKPKPKRNYLNNQYRTNNYDANNYMNAHVVPSKPVPVQEKIKKKCSSFPNCQLGSKCRFIHPEEMCTYWPKCPYGMSCFYIHPEIPCKFNINCTQPKCNYSHPPDWNPVMATSRYDSFSGTFHNVTYYPKNNDD